MYVEIAWTRQRILASYLHNYKLRKLVFSVSKKLFFMPLNKIRMPLFVSLDDIFFVQFFTNITAMLCARYPWNFYRDLKLLVKNAIWKCDLKMRKKRFSTCKSGDAECEMRHGILIGKFIFWCLRYYDYRIWFW